ncbi:MAG: nucleoside triphosphate pyrophosphohydrolase family protein [Candidatus Aenigmatarchaeota archaeon]
MEFDEYQEKAGTTAMYPDVGNNFIYPTLGLAGETGEIVEKVKKLIRDKNSKPDGQFKEEIKRELGDLLWYMARVSSEFGISLSDVAATNINKLESRKSRDKIHGEGDSR